MANYPREHSRAYKGIDNAYASAPFANKDSLYSQHG